MTKEEIKSIQDIQGSAGFRVIVALLVNRVDELNKVSEIDLDKPNIEAKVIGRSLAVKWCQEIINEINLNPNSNMNSVKRTYE